MSTKTPTITIHDGVACGECGRSGATDSGICLPCITKAIGGKRLRTARGRAAAQSMRNAVAKVVKSVLVLTIALLSTALAHAAPTITLVPVQYGYPQAGAFAFAHDPTGTMQGFRVVDNANFTAQCTGYAQVGVTDLACRFWPQPGSIVHEEWTPDRVTWGALGDVHTPANFYCVPSGWPATGVCCSRRIRNRRCA